MIRRILEISPLLWILIACGLGYWNYYDWKSTELVRLESEQSQKESELKAAQAQTLKAEDFKRQRAEKLEQLRELAERFRATADRLPRSAKIADLLKSLADISDKTGLDFSRFRPQAEKRQQFLVLTPLEVTLKGTYLQIMSFLDAVANLTRVLNTEKLTLDNAVPRGSVSVLNATATIVSYHIEDTAIEGAVSSAPSKVPDPKAKKEGKK